MAQAIGVERASEWFHDAGAAAAVAAIVSGVPSTLHGLLVTGEPLEATLAAGAFVLPREQRAARLVAAAAVLHAGLSLGWALMLARVLPARHTVLAGAVAGVGIAALDLGLIARRDSRIRRLPLLPQLADHVAFGATVAAVLRARRARGRH